MRKILILIGLCLGLVGCSMTYTQPLNLNQADLPTANVNQPSPDTQAINTANWKTYTSDKIGISFKYPPELGEITEDFFEPTGMITVLADRVPFLALYNPDYSVPEQFQNWASEGDWRSESMYIDTQTSIDNACSDQTFIKTLALEKSSCSVLSNGQNISYARISAGQALVAMDDIKKDVTFYLVYNPNSEYRGIIVTDADAKYDYEYIESVKDNHITTKEVNLASRFENIEKVIEDIVQTIKFN